MQLFMRMQKISWLMVMPAVVLLACSATALAVNSMPFSDQFEGYSNADPLDGNNGWVASDSSVVATNSIKYAGSNSGYVPESQALTNQATVNASSNVWVDMFVQVTLRSSGADDPTPDSGAVAQFFFNENGYPVVLNGTLTNWVTLTETYANTTLTNITTGAWVRVSVFLNYTDEEWGLYVNDQLVKDDIAFHTTDTQFDEFAVENETYIDNYWVNTVSPDNSTSNAAAILASDTDSDGMGDAFEMDYWGDATTASGSGDYDDDGLSNAEEYQASPSTDPTVADNSARPLPYRDGFDNATVGAVAGSGWHGMTNSGLSVVAAANFDPSGSKGLMLSNGLMNVAFSSSDGTNVWVETYIKPVFASSSAEPTPSDSDVALFYISTGGLLRAYTDEEWTNLVTLPANTWIGLAAHLDYNTCKWDLYVSTDGIYGDVMTRANAAALEFNSNAVDNATSLTNYIIELPTATNMYIDVMAASYGQTNLVAAYTNVIAYDRIVGVLKEAGAPPYNYGAINSVTNSIEGRLGQDLAWSLAAGDELQVSYTNGWNVYDYDGSAWQNDGNGMVASNLYVNAGTGLKIRKKSGRDTVVFYPFGEYISLASNILIQGSDSLVAGWNYIVSPYDNKITANDPSQGFNFTNNATAGDRIYIDEVHELTRYSDGVWRERRNVSATNSIDPGEGFWYYKKSAGDFYWEVQGQ